MDSNVKKSERVGWADAFRSELVAVNRRRSRAATDENDLVGLAISGGGIRSATFALGVIERLRAYGILKQMDVLSTVSGGGYVGAWLSANCRRRAGWLEPETDWTESIRHLRRHSNYLSPSVGFFSADTWSMVTIWLRNTLLIQTTVILAIACALLLPRPLFALFEYWPSVGYLRWVTVLLFLLGIIGVAGNQLRITGAQPDQLDTGTGSTGTKTETKKPGGAWLLRAENWPRSLAYGAAAVAIAWAYGVWVAFDPFQSGQLSYAAAAPIAVLLVLASFVLQPAGIKAVASVWPDEDRPREINYTQNWVQGAIVVPLMTVGYLMAAILWERAVSGGLQAFHGYGDHFRLGWRYWPFPLSVVFASIWLLSFCAIRDRRDWTSRIVAFSAPFIAVPALHGLLSAVMLLLQGWAASPADGAWKAFVWAPPLVALSFVLTIVVLIGMLGRQSTDDVREWWSRLGAWLGIYASAWMIIAVAAVYGPQWVSIAIEQHPWTSLTAGGGWVSAVAAGLFAGKSDSSGTTADKAPTKTAAERARDLLATAAPYLFILGLLIGVAYALDVVISPDSSDDWSHAGHGAYLGVSFAVLSACVLGMLLMAARVDINAFSLNAFYRHRLVRCYLGATRPPNERNPQAFTGFDDADDLPLTAFQDGAAAGPLHIVNCALNLGGSSDLALHTRHSAAFTLGPFHCGSAYLSRDQAGRPEEIGYVETAKYGGPAGVPTLGQAISVSGAAASPNMGYHTSAVVAFLLTLFNVRLGWWFPNPAKAGAGVPSPRFNLRYLVAELFGGATDASQFVMVSDGGHFENLAAYELVRRRCKVIIIIDGECDPNRTFEGLGTLIRMCEVDFGAQITIDVDAIRATGKPWSSRNWAVGEIDYGRGGSGVLVYLKASMTGGEDTSVLQYKASHPDFPHESTGDQFYREDQFESYRRLGRTVATAAFDAVRSEPNVSAVAVALLAALRRHADDSARR